MLIEEAICAPVEGQQPSPKGNANITVADAFEQVLGAIVANLGALGEHMHPPAVAQAGHPSGLEIELLGGRLIGGDTALSPLASPSGLGDEAETLPENKSSSSNDLTAAEMALVVSPVVLPQVAATPEQLPGEQASQVHAVAAKMLAQTDYGVFVQQAATSSDRPAGDLAPQAAIADATMPAHPDNGRSQPQSPVALEMREEMAGTPPNGPDATKIRGVFKPFQSKSDGVATGSAVPTFDAKSSTESPAVAMPAQLPVARNEVVAGELEQVVHEQVRTMIQKMSELERGKDGNGPTNDGTDTLTSSDAQTSIAGAQAIERQGVPRNAILQLVPANNSGEGRDQRQLGGQQSDNPMQVAATPVESTASELMVLGTKVLLRPEASQDGSHKHVDFGGAIPIAEQIAARAHWTLAKGKQSVAIDLEPKELGKVRLSLTASIDGTHIMVVADGKEAHRLIQAAVAELRSTLEGRGVQVAGLEVTLGFGSQDRQSQSSPSHEYRGRSGSDDDLEPVSVLSDPPADSREPSFVGHQTKVDYRI